MRNADSDLWTGLCQGPLLERVSSFFLSPTLSHSAQAIQAIFFGSGIERARPGRPPVAVIHCMTKITPENIAYAATQVCCPVDCFDAHAMSQLRFALSSVVNWGLDEDYVNFDAFFQTIQIGRAHV